MRENLEGVCEHVKFFRFRSAFVLTGEGSRSDLWLAQSIQYIDYSIEDLTREYFLIAHYSKGGYSFNEIKDMDFKTFMKVLKEASRIQDEEFKSVNKTQEQIDG